MFCSKTTYKLIEKIQRRVLRALCNVYDLPLDALLEIDGLSHIHVLKIRCILIEIYKTVHHLNPSLMGDIFILKPVLCETLINFPSRSLTTVRYGVNSLAFHSNILWNNLSSCHKQYETHAFKENIKKCSTFRCSCMLCKFFLYAFK